MPDVEGPMDPIDPPPSEPSTTRKKPLWLKDILEDVEKHIASRTFRDVKILSLQQLIYSSYLFHNKLFMKLLQ